MNGAAGLAGLVLILLADTADAQAPDSQIALSCQAAGDVASSSSTYEWVKQPNGRESFERKRHPTVVRKEVRYELRIGPDGGRLRMPEETPGLFAKRPEGGWYLIEQLQLGDDEIRGRVNFGLLDVQPLRIDRRTGALAIGEFKGACEKTPTERKF